VSATRLAVAAPNPDAVLAATDVALAGGNAVDAAVAAMVVAMVTEPGVVSPLGGAFVALATPSGEQLVVDGNVEMPGRGAGRERFGAGMREVTTTYGGGLTLSVGHGSVATPGAVAALGEAHARYGRVPWREVLAPAAAVCRTGYRLGAAAGSYLAITGEEVFGWDPQTRSALTRPDGTFVQPGDLVRSPDLADALEALATEGPSSLYTGSLGRAVAADMDARGGLVTAADLAAYRPVVRPGLGTRVGTWSLSTNPPPAIGGPVLAAMLRLVVDSPGGLGDVVDVQRRVLAYRAEHLDRAADLEVAGRELWDLVRDRGVHGLPTSASTAHVSVVGGDGTACAITASSGYGSGATVPGTGLLLNNCLGEPELNRSGVHALAPGTRLASNMAPTTGRSDDGAVLAVGSPGADRITTALLQVLLAYCVGGRPLQDAIDAPRVHVRLDPEPALEHEEDVAGAAEVAAALGLPAHAHPANHMYFGGVGAALLGRDGSLQAAGDPRRAAATGVV
jgi:gamma-glutamyltranspeptidase/glutathione hydrolase